MFLSKLEGYIVFAIFFIATITVTFYNKSKKFNIDTFLISNRDIPWFINGVSIAATWIWGPALFLSSMQAFEDGYVGLFWFLLPNFTCFYLYVLFAEKFRKLMPNGYTLAEFMKVSYNNSKLVHVTYIILILLCQITALVLNSVIGAKLISTITGINTNTVILLIITITTAYSLISGFKASVLTDCLQMIIIYIFIVTIIPLVLYKTGGISTLASNLTGINNKLSLIDLDTLKFFAIPTFITLWTGPITDQMFFQRVMGNRRNSIKKSFISASFIYIIVPLSLSLLGFVGTYLIKNDSLQISDNQLIGGIVISSLFGKIIIGFYLIMILAGLCSTIDSALCATSSIGFIDIYDNYLKKHSPHISQVTISRLFMIVISVMSITIAFLKPNLKEMFFIIGTIRASGFFPTILTLLKKNTLPYLFPIIIGSAIFVSLPLSIYANIYNIPNLVPLSSLSALIFPFIIYYVGYKIKN